METIQSLPEDSQYDYGAGYSSTVGMAEADYTMKYNDPFTVSEKHIDY